MNLMSTQKPLESALKLLGDPWVLGIIQHLEPSPLRFCALQRQLHNLNPVTLTNRLKRLESAGLIGRQEETIDKISVTYLLTAKGRSVLPVIRALEQFASIGDGQLT